MSRTQLTFQEFQEVTATITGWLNEARKDVEQWTSNTWEPPAQAEVDAYETALYTLTTYQRQSDHPALDEAAFLAAITVLESHQSSPTDLSGDYPTPEGEVYEQQCQGLEVSAFSRVISLLRGENVITP